MRGREPGGDPPEPPASAWTWGVAAPRPARRPAASIALRLGALLVGAALVARRGHVAIAAALVAVAVLATVAAALSPAIARHLDRGAAAVGRAAGRAVALVGIGAVELLVSLPGRAIASVRRRDPLTGVHAGARSTWRPRVAPSPGPGVRADRLWSTDLGAVPLRPARRFPRTARAVPVIALLLLVDLVAGSLLPQPQVAPWVQASAEVLGPAEPGIPGVPASLAGLASAPALDDEPWADGCLRDVDALEYDFQPFLVRRLRDVDRGCVQVEDGERRGWRPPGDDLPEVWVLGGSAAFGAGLRPEATLASELARGAHADGRPVVVRTFATPGATAYQEALQLEQLLAVRPAPALVVLYDGINDVAAQLASPTDRATWLPFTLWRSDEPANVRSLVQRWGDASFSARAWHWFGAQAAAAEPAVDDAAIAELALATYRRGAELAARVGALHGVPVRSAFQATTLGVDHPVVRAVVRGLPASVIDLSDAVEREHFIDAVHVDEQGSAAVAAELRAELAGTVLAGGGG